MKRDEASRKYGAKEVLDMSKPKNWEIWPAPPHEEVLYQTFPEFTCLCPRSGYPDFATVHLVTVPDKKVVELKCLKLWLNSFRNKGISHENATQTIAQTLFDTLGLKQAFVLMQYTPRGNLTTFPMTELIREGAKIERQDEVRIIKEILLRKVIGGERQSITT